MNRQLKVLLLSSAFFTLAGGLLGPIYAIFVENIGGDVLTAGTSYSLYAIASGILIYILGKWEDHVAHQEHLVVFGYLLNCIGFIGYLLIREPIHLFIVQVIFGIGNAINTPAFDGMYSKSLDLGNYASEWGMWESMNWIVTAIAALAGGLMAEVLGFQALFLAMAIASFIGFGVSLFLYDKKPENAKNTAKGA